GGARPDRRNVDHLHREERILGTAKPLIGEETGGAQHDHQEQDQGGMAHRPAREIEALHVTLQLRNLFAFPPSLRAQRSNPSSHGKKVWIASSRTLLAMTSRQ